MKLFFCQNDCPIRGEFWQNNSFITHILFELHMPILIISPVQIIMGHPLIGLKNIYLIIFTQAGFNWQPSQNPPQRSQFVILIETSHFSE